MVVSFLLFSLKLTFKKTYQDMSVTGRRSDLDGLRGIAILLTLILHYISRGGHFPVQHLPQPVFHLLDSFWSGVDIFFVLSGFLIGGIILDNRRSENFLKVFYLRRALRILPVAVVAILFAYFAIPAFGAASPTGNEVPPLAYLLFINNYWTASGVPAYAPLGPMWSLAIEEQFYLVAPMAMLIMGRQHMIAGLVLILLASPWMRLVASSVSPWDFTLYRFDGLAAGILIAIMLRSHRFIAYAKANRQNMRMFMLLIVVAMLLFHTSSVFTLNQRVAFGVSLNSLAAAGTILYLSTSDDSRLSAVLSRKWLVLLGHWSYFLYLMHIPVLICVRATEMPSPLVPAGALVICLTSAWLSYQYFEGPLIRLGRQRRYK